MPSTTFLNIINTVLSSIDSQQVSKVDATVESEQVADIINRCYLEILTLKDWDFLKKEGKLIPTYTKPNLMKLPDDCYNCLFVKYNKKRIKYLKPDEFRNLIDSRSSGNINDDGIYIDRDPSYYTSFDNTVLVFDSYNSAEGVNLLESNSYVLYIKAIDELAGEDDIIEMPYRMIPVLVDYAIAKAMYELKNDINGYRIYANKYMAGISRMVRMARKINEDVDRYDLNVNYGRHGGRSVYSR